MVIAGTEMHIGSEPPVFLPHDERHFCMGLKVYEPVHYLNSCVFEIARPANISFFVETCFEFHQRGHRFA